MEVLIVPDHPAESEFEDRKSVFLGHLLPVESEEEAKDFVEKMKKRYGDARHNVWAYRLTDGNFRSSDDGEPSGTGGAPVLDAMVKRGIYGCVIVVTRYFGGIPSGHRRTGARLFLSRLRGVEPGWKSRYLSLCVLYAGVGLYAIRKAVPSA